MKKTVFQLLREFVVPFLCALGWASYDWYVLPVGNRTLPHAVSTFGATFFFVSWMSGQVFRVRKQQKVEDKLHGIENNIRGLISELKAVATDVIGNTTGGDSICYLHSDLAPPGGGGTSILYVAGKYALHDVHIEVCDLDQLRRPTYAMGQSRNDRPMFKFDIVLPGVSYPLNYQFPEDPLSPESRSFNLIYFARNGVFNQLVRKRKVDGVWYTATRVSNGVTISAYEWIQTGYPTEADGTVNWDG